MKSEKERVKRLIVKHCEKRCRSGVITWIRAGMNSERIQVSVDTCYKVGNPDLLKLNEKLGPLEDALRALFPPRKADVDIWPEAKNKKNRMPTKHFSIRKLEIFDLPLSQTE